MNTNTNAKTFAQSLRDRGIYSSGWLIYHGPGVWYGIYGSREAAQRRLGTKDSCGSTVRGIIVQIPTGGATKSLTPASRL